uniref:EGF-like domain-containing protein n=1 Tax=Strongyloides venezuelensis TaxID=75913 RepID=A0A0K0F145_STRVS
MEVIHIRQTERLYFIDVKTLNYHYCSYVCQNTIECNNQGYQNLQYCDECRCVEEFYGTHCEEIAKQRRGCRNSVIWVADKVTIINFKGKKIVLLFFKQYKEEK